MSDDAGETPLSIWSRPRRPGEAPRPVLGTMNFGRRTPAADAERIILRALERGVVHFDTANAYCDGESERILGRALGARRADVLVATKVGFGRVTGKPEGLARARVLSAFDESRKRLGVDVVDLYYLHVPDHETPIDETLDAIAELLDNKLVRAFAASNYASWQLLEMLVACDRRAMPRPVVSQVLYNLLIRQLDLEYARFARRYQVHSMVYNALGGGLLSGRHERGEPPAGSRFHKNALYQGRYWSDRMFDLVDAYREVADAEAMSLADLAYAWLAGSAVVDSILLGPATVEQLDQALDACARAVSPQGRRRIDEIHRAFVGTETSYAR